ncbi:MAG: tripartite tricarboxylate transporter substrate binding protein [Betaproteobacteria bacterium]|nr:tripartite tricarboxylate transporter substrate binding protein [Betaproteobacteria bacterium]
MKRLPRRGVTLSLLTLAMLAVLTGLSGFALAQSFPQRAVRIIVPFPPGGGQDVVARTIAKYLSENWGQAVTVDNRAGGKTLIGAEQAARAAADGHTMIMVSVEVLINTGLLAPSSVNMQRDLASVILCSTGVNVVAVGAGSRLRSVKDIIAQARATPGKLSYGSAGVGSTGHMAGEQLMLIAGISLLHVPYKGTTTSLTDAMSGQIDMLIAGAPPLLTLFQSGKLRAIAVGSRKRFPLLPEVPTVDESGLAGFEMSTFAGLMAPAKTPPAIINRLNKDIGVVLEKKEVIDLMLSGGTVAIGGSPEDMTSFIQERGATLKRLIEVAKISID